MDGNRILAALSPSERTSILERSTLEKLPSEQNLWDQGIEITHTYLPTTAVISLLQTMSNGLSVEAASIGNEGIVEPPLAFSDQRSLARAVCQVSGEAWKISSSTFADFRNHFPNLERLVFRYAYVLMR